VGGWTFADLWEVNADAVAVVFHGTFASRIDALRDRLPKVKGWLWVDDGSGPCPAWATPYEDAAACSVERQRGPWGRDGDHLYMLYTGGTTGMPKGVMWRQDDLIMLLASQLGAGFPEEPDYEAVRAMRAAPGAIALPACPLMHGTGALISMVTLTQAGCVVLLADVQRHRRRPLLDPRRLRHRGPRTQREGRLQAVSGRGHRAGGGCHRVMRRGLTPGPRSPVAGWRRAPEPPVSSLSFPPASAGTAPKERPRCASPSPPVRSTRKRCASGTGSSGTSGCGLTATTSTSG
jgi:hypothetical protein